MSFSLIYLNIFCPCGGLLVELEFIFGVTIKKTIQQNLLKQQFLQVTPTIDIDCVIYTKHDFLKCLHLPCCCSAKSFRMCLDHEFLPAARARVLGRKESE